MQYAYRPESPGRQPSNDLLTEVEKVYGHLIDCLTEMREVTSGPLPEPFRYTRARYRISNASLKRRQLFDRICSHLAPRLSIADAARLRTLRQKDRAYLHHSATYVTKWAPKRSLLRGLATAKKRKTSSATCRKWPRSSCGSLRLCSCVTAVLAGAHATWPRKSPGVELQARSILTDGRYWLEKPQILRHQVR